MTNHPNKKCIKTTKHWHVTINYVNWFLNALKKLWSSKKYLLQNLSDAMVYSILNKFQNLTGIFWSIIKFNLDGYIKNSAGTGCEKLCENCINGNCVSRDQCECLPGYEGASCDVAVDFINETNESHEWSNMIEFDFHFKAHRRTIWICASVLSVFTLVIAINLCFGRPQTKLQTSDVKAIDNPNNYAGNIVLAAASTCKPKMHPGIHCAGAAQWTRPPLNRSKSIKSSTVLKKFGFTF